MKLLGTAAHSRCTVMRLNSRMVPEPQLQTQSISQAAAVASGVLRWAQPKDRFALWHREELPSHTTLLLLLQDAQGQNTVLSLVCKDTEPVKERRGPSRGKGRDRTLHALGSPAASPAPRLDFVCPFMSDMICVQALACVLWSLKGAKDIARWI